MVKVLYGVIVLRQHPVRRRRCIYVKGDEGRGRETEGSEVFLCKVLFKLTGPIRRVVWLFDPCVVRELLVK